MKYSCILADPPWQFNDRGSRIAPDHAGHYETMSLSGIIGLGDRVREWSVSRSHLWLWAPNAFVLDGTAQLVVKQWGFRPRQLLTWCKQNESGNVQIGMGHWLRNSTEQLLLCTRGTLKAMARNAPTHIVAPRGKHSAKPTDAYSIIERVSPEPRLELFARSVRVGWESWGHEAPEETRIESGEAFR